MAIKKLDVVTQVCPFPLIEAKAALAEMASGDELVIEFDCTQATEAIPQWAAEEGHAITDYQQIGDAAWSITVQKVWPNIVLRRISGGGFKLDDLFRVLPKRF